MGKGGKRAVFVNGVYCNSLTDAMGFVSLLVGKEVSERYVRKLANGEIKKNGITISEAKQEPKKECLIKIHNYGEPLLRYPEGSSPIKRGINNGIR